MPFNRTIILADDLTGANDTAIQFVNQGLLATVVTHGDFSDSLDVESYDAIAINSNSRGMNAEEAYHTVREMIRRLGAKRGGCFFYKKIDSVLRGNPGEELAAVMDELDIPLALAAPSFPANRSVMEHGLLSSGRNGSGSAGDIDAVKIFAGGTNRKVKNIPLEEIRRGRRAVAEYIETHSAGGAQVFVADAVTDGDLRIVYRTAASLGKPLVLAGAAALAHHAAQDLGRKKSGGSVPAVTEPPVSLPPRCDSVLVIAGTQRGETAAQITTLSRIMSVPIVRFKADLAALNKSEDAISEAYHEAADQMREKPGLCIVAVETMFRTETSTGNVDGNQVEGDTAGKAIVSALGILTRKLLDDFRFSAIISTGGDTSLGICRHLEIKRIEPLAEICPGIPVGRIAGGARTGRYIITKSGRFGDERSLVEIMAYLGLNQESGMAKGMAL
jgi:uncharacterized protein YgbK (DUF1537 family)